MIAVHRNDRCRPLTATVFVIALALVPLASPALAGCPPEPRSQEACGSFGQTRLAMDAYGHFDWRASQGPATNLADYADPSATLKLCAWDEERLVVAADILADAECPGGSCWSQSDRQTRRYRDEPGANGDVRLFDFTGSDSSRTKLRTQTTVVGGIILPVLGGVIVQMLNTNTGACLESFVPAESFTLDDRAAFAARFSLDDAE
jgi:hypothetical protein